MRNSTLRIAGILITVLALSLMLTSPAAAEQWRTESTPTGENLYGVENTVNGTFAVGTGGDVLKRTASGWITVTDTGPGGNSNSLYGAGVTDGGKALWFVGSSGAVGRYNVVTGNLKDLSGLNGLSTNNFNEVSVVGNFGNASIYIAGDSGKVYYSYDSGRNWNSVTPGSGAAINSIDFSSNTTGHVVDANKKVYETTDSGKTWTDIGISGAGESLLDVDSNSVSNVWVSASNGVVYKYDGTGWRNITVSQRVGLRGIEINNQNGYTVGGNGSVYVTDSQGFSREDTNTSNTLRSVAIGSVNVAVGNSGTSVVRDTGGNSAPVADFVYSPSQPNVGETVNFDASGSVDSDGSINSYKWDFNGDGSTDSTGVSASATYSYSSEGTYGVSLTVVDDNGATDTVTMTVSVTTSSSNQLADTVGGQDNQIDNSEILDAIKKWRTGQTVAGQTISNSEILDLIKKWRTGAMV